MRLFPATVTPDSHYMTIAQQQATPLMLDFSADNTITRLEAP
jgi:hypothetical protein